jgi:hypothetical protein
MGVYIENFRRNQKFDALVRPLLPVPPSREMTLTLLYSFVPFRSSVVPKKVRLLFPFSSPHSFETDFPPPFLPFSHSPSPIPLSPTVLADLGVRQASRKMPKAVLFVVPFLFFSLFLELTPARPVGKPTALLLCFDTPSVIPPPPRPFPLVVCHSYRSLPLSPGFPLTDVFSSFSRSNLSNRLSWSLRRPA